jgi:hypothetical protein
MYKNRPDGSRLARKRTQQEVLRAGTRTKKENSSFWMTGKGPEDNFAPRDQPGMGSWAKRAYSDVFGEAFSSIRRSPS